MTNTVYSDGTPTISLAYNRAGRQIQAIDAAGVTTFLYDDFGALTNETVVGVAGTNTIERFYDSLGRDLGYALNGVRQSTLAYDAATGRLATMLVPEAQSNNQTNQKIKQFSWSYLPGSDLKSSLAYPNGLTASWTYGNRGELLEVNNASPTGTISRYAYTYDAAGRRIACAKLGTAFEQSDSVNYGYNTRSELTNATAAVDSAYRYSYDFDDIGNRNTSSERGTNATYTANNLNQYMSLDAFVPQYDADGNQTLVKTTTGTWQVSYNGENRPILWTQGTNTISMSFDRMGRRVTKNNQRFIYNGYLQIANFRSTTTTSDYNCFVWDPTEPVATRPLAWKRGTSVAYYTHDGNKNVSEVIDSNNDVAAHYEYAPFGALTVSRGASAAANPWRFSSEYAEDDTATVYYNYRHYEPVMGRWLGRDPIEEEGSVNLWGFVDNTPLDGVDALGCQSFSSRLYLDPEFEWRWEFKDGVKVLTRPGVNPWELNEFKEWVRKMIKFDQIVDVTLEWTGYCAGDNNDTPVIEDVSVDFNVVEAIDVLDISIEDLPLGKKAKALLKGVGVNINLQIAGGWSVVMNGHKQQPSRDKKCMSKTVDIEIFESGAIGLGVVKSFKAGSTATVGIDTSKAQYSKSKAKQSITITQCCCGESSKAEVSGGQHIDAYGIDRSAEGQKNLGPRVLH